MIATTPCLTEWGLHGKNVVDDTYPWPGTSLSASVPTGNKNQKEFLSPTLPTSTHQDKHDYG
jgi:hypothetical protein